MSNKVVSYSKKFMTVNIVITAEQQARKKATGKKYKELFEMGLVAAEKK